jgi:hypothetical protein
MNIFQLRPERHLSRIYLLTNLHQTMLDLVEFLITYQALLAEHSGVRDRTSDVLSVKAVIKTNALAKGHQPRIAGRFEDSTSTR